MRERATIEYFIQCATHSFLAVTGNKGLYAPETVFRHSYYYTKSAISIVSLLYMYTLCRFCVILGNTTRANCHYNMA